MRSVQLPTFAINGELTLDYATSRRSGYGHRTITVEMIYKGQKKEFSKTTNNMHDYDEAMDLDYEERKEALYNIIAYSIEEEIANWTQEVDYEEEN